MSTPVLTGQAILDDLRVQLGALSNAFTVDQLLLFINKGVQEVWTVLRSLDLDYFTDSSQDSTPSNDNFFADLDPAKREYDLPTNCREPRMIEVLTTGFEDRVFEYRESMSDPVFQAARRQATAYGGQQSQAYGPTPAHYYYTIFGNQLILAQYPEAPLNVKLWSVASIDDITLDDVPAPLHPFNAKIVDYAAQRAMLSTQNIDLSAAWLALWKEDVKAIVISTGTRASTNATFIGDYMGS